MRDISLTSGILSFAIGILIPRGCVSILGSVTSTEISLGRFQEFEAEDPL